MLFQFNIRHEAGFDVYGSNVRNCLSLILQVLENPCLGQRLRHPPGLPETPPEKLRWDDFCKIELPYRLRMIYPWYPGDGYIDIVALGPHLGHGEFGDVYDDLAVMFDLPTVGGGFR